MKKVFLKIVFFAFCGFLIFADPAFDRFDEYEEIGFFLFLPNSSDSFVNEDHAIIQLDNLAKYLAGMNLTFARIYVIGYAAAALNDIKPADLSRDRALFIINKLQNHGLPYYLFSESVGLGEVDFWGDNTTEEERSPNRRVRILIKFDNIGGEVTIHEISAYDDPGRPSGFPWKIFLIPVFVTILTAILLFFLKRRKSSISDSDRHKETPHTKTTHIKRSNYMDLEKTIRETISGIPSDAYFDVHTVIEKLLQEHDDVYLMNVGHYTSAAQYHSKISAIIAETGLVDKIGNSFSKNIHDKFSECHLFKRKA